MITVTNNVYGSQAYGLIGLLTNVMQTSNVKIYVPRYNDQLWNNPFDDDPLTEEEIKDLAISKSNLHEGRFRVIPSECSNEDFLRLLG